MTEPHDPGWKPAISMAGRIATGRSLDGSMLLVMRSAAIFLGVAAAVIGLAVLILGAGSQEPRIGSGTARILISAATGTVLIGISVVGRGGPDVADAGQLGVSAFRITMRRMLIAAALGPIGMVLSWLSGDATYVVFGTGLALLLIAVASPTSRRIEQFQSEVDEAEASLSVLDALLRPFR